MVFDAALLNTQHYKVRIKGNVEQSRNKTAPFPTALCGSYRKGSLRVTLDYGRQLYFYFSILACFFGGGSWFVLLKLGHVLYADKYDNICLKK